MKNSPYQLEKSSSEPADSGYGSLHAGIGRFKRIGVVLALSFLLIPVIIPAFQSFQVHAEPTENETQFALAEVQSIAVDAVNFTQVARDGYSATQPAPKVTAIVVPRSTNADVLAAQAYALTLIQAKGWGTEQYNCLVNLWHKESGWRYDAQNRSSGAYGIPQALPGSKMASAGSDWQTNPETQIRWGMSYIQGRYGTPCGAWNFFLAKNWY